MDQTKAMCTQSARQAIMLTPRDLVSYMSTNVDEKEQNISAAEGSLLSSFSSQIQFVVIDIRTAEDVEIGGIIPRAVRLDPEALENEDLIARYISYV